MLNSAAAQSNTRCVCSVRQQSPRPRCHPPSQQLQTLLLFKSFLIPVTDAKPFRNQNQSASLNLISTELLIAYENISTGYVPISSASRSFFFSLFLLFLYESCFFFCLVSFFLSNYHSYHAYHYNYHYFSCYMVPLDAEESGWVSNFVIQENMYIYYLNPPRKRKMDESTNRLI